MDNERLMLERQIEMIIKQSRDTYYNEYLHRLLLRLNQHTVTTQYVTEELNRTYRLYQQRMQAFDAQMQAAHPQAPLQWQQGGTQPTQPYQVQLQQQPQAAQGQPQQFQGAQHWQQGRQPQSYQGQPQQLQGAQHWQQYKQPQPPQGHPQQFQTAQTSGWQQGWQPQQPPQPKRNMEFAIGAGLLSVVGVLFLLISFVMLGMNYMNGMVKGICLYVIALAVLLFSELVLQKKMPKFAVGITGLSICALYLSTILNSIILKNFSGWIAMVISVAISLLAILISRKKDSGMIKIINFIGCYICIIPITINFINWYDSYYYQGTTAQMYFLVTIGIVLIVNLMTIFLPVKKNKVEVHITHLVTNTVFTIVFAYMVSNVTDMSEYIQVLLLSSVLTQGLIFYSLVKERLAQEVKISTETASYVTVYVSTTALLLVVLVLESPFGDPFVFHIVTGMLLLVFGFLFYLFRNSVLKWIQYWLACATVILIYLFTYNYWFNDENRQWWKMGMTIGLFLIAKILSRIKILRVSELIITLFTVIQAIYFFVQPDLTIAICFLGVFLLSMVALHYWKSLYEGILIFVLEAFVLINFRNGLTPAVMLCILFLGVIGFNYIEFFRGKHIKIFNYINLGLMSYLYLLAAFRKNNMSYAIMLILGIAFMALAFRDKFGMNFKIKNIIFVLFLCYMTLIWDIPVHFFKSIILMVIAIGAVVSGFVLKEKRLRITGLTLTLTVCAKIVLYDFISAATTERMLLFLIVGMIVLGISGIYIALEKKIV